MDCKLRVRLILVVGVLVLLTNSSVYVDQADSNIQEGLFLEAEKTYKKVLSLDPSDMDAKFNLEFVREQLKKKEEQEKNSDKNDSSKQNKDQSEQQKSKNEEKDKKQESNQNENSPSDNEPQQKEQSETAKTSPQELSQEEAEQLLGNLSEDLKKFSQMQAGKIKPAQPYKNNLW